MGKGIRMYDQKTALEKIDSVIAQGPYEANWASLSRFEVPKWYKNAKFGIFLHFGVYSVPAFGSEWYPRNMYIRGSREYEHHIKTYGKHTEFGYKDFIPMFKAEKFDPEAWAELFRSAGAKYVVPVAEHHDGFQMYRSDLSHYNAFEMGPKRDIVGELRRSCESRGMVFGASSHRAEHWFFLGHGREFESDVCGSLKRGDLYWPAMPEGELQDLYSTPAPTEEYLNDWLIRTCELIDRYQPKLLYFDWWIQHSAFRPYLPRLAAFYYNRAAQWGEQVAINYKHDAFLFGSAVPDVERGQFSEMKPYFWQTDTAAARNSWCYTEGNDYKSAKSLICDLCDIVSKNGTLLLNVGPKPDGTIGEEDTKILNEIGKWLSKNGEAVYESRTFRKYGEGPTNIEEGQFTDNTERTFTSQDIRFTMRDDFLYAIVLSWPTDGKVTIRSLANADASRLPVYNGIPGEISILGYEGVIETARDENGLHVCADGIKTEMPVVIRIRMT